MNAKALLLTAIFLSSAASAAAAAASATSVLLQAKAYVSSVDGKQTALYTLRNSSGFSVAITNFGARIEQILAPDRDGRLGDVTQGYDDIAGVRQGQASMGAFIGRYANRIAHGQFSLNGVDYQLNINDVAKGDHPRSNTLHGGAKGSRFVVFNSRRLSPASVEMTYVFKDGEENFPGTLPVRVVYTVGEDNSLTIDWEASADDKETVANFTQHTFFNLSGDPGAPIGDELLTINADKALEFNEELAPTGGFFDVAGTPFDFRKPKPIGRDIGAADPRLQAPGGYDAHFVIKRGAESLALAARVVDPASGRSLEVWTTDPGVQFYSGNFLEGKTPRDVGKNGRVYHFRTAFCLEPSFFPDSVNHANFPDTRLKPGEWRTGQIVYRFSTVKN